MTLSKKFKQSKKPVAAFLIFAMAISFLPAGMFSGFSREASDKEAYVLGEDVEKRKADEKHFIMSDGTMMAVKYSEQVHYQADAGKWVEIDNSLSYDTKLKKFTNKNNHSITYDGSIIQIAGSKEAIFDYGYTEDDI